jgi:hypothetical protein
MRHVAFGQIAHVRKCSAYMHRCYNHHASTPAPSRVFVSPTWGGGGSPFVWRHFDLPLTCPYPPSHLVRFMLTPMYGVWTIICGSQDKENCEPPVTRKGAT